MAEYIFIRDFIKYFVLSAKTLMIQIIQMYFWIVRPAEIGGDEKSL